MALKVWLPLNGDLHNQGCSDVSVTNYESTIDINGKIGSCYSFGTTKSYLKFDNTDFMHNFTECSVSLWLKILSWNTSYATYFQFGLGSTPWTHYIFGLLRNSTASTLCFTISNGSSATNASCLTPALSLNTWYHLTLTYSSGHCKIYVNGIETRDYVTSIVPDFSRITTGTIGIANNLSGYQTNCLINDFRIYDHALSAAEVKEISQGLVLHYKLNSLGNGYGNQNLGNTSADYSNKTNGLTVNASGWGGDAGTVTFYHSGGYANLPYKMYHKTATGSGGIYSKTANDIILEADTTYTMSCWIKASRAFNASAHTFNINRGADNLYITYGTTIPITTEWKFFSKTFTTTSTQNGSYGEMSIVYDDGATDYYVYYSGFKIEKGSIATEWCPPNASLSTVQDNSGYENNGNINNNPTISLETIRYSSSMMFNGIDDSIVVPYNSICPENIFTINLWFKKDSLGSKNYETLFGGPSGFEMDTRAGAASALSLYMASTRSGKRNLITPLEFGKWFMITMTRDGAKERYYVNGIFQSEIDAKSMPNGIYRIGAWASNTGQNYYGLISDFRIYCTPLSDEDILSLYQVQARIDDANNLHIYEIKESDLNLLMRLTATGQLIGKEIIENEITRLCEDGIVETNTIIER